MDSALEYMANLHQTLINDYRIPDGRYCESCGGIALDIAEKLLAEGKSPEIVSIRGKFVDGMNRSPIIPIPFEGRITWGAHMVYCDNNLAYDPMISREPVAVGDYCHLAFEGEVDMEVEYNQDETKELIQKYTHTKKNLDSYK